MHAANSLKHPEQTTKVLQPVGEHASNDFVSRPQPHLSMPVFGRNCISSLRFCVPSH